MLSATANQDEVQFSLVRCSPNFTLSSSCSHLVSHFSNCFIVSCSTTFLSSYPFSHRHNQLTPAARAPWISNPQELTAHAQHLWVSLRIISWLNSSYPLRQLEKYCQWWHRRRGICQWIHGDTCNAGGATWAREITHTWVCRWYVIY